jgi:RNA polymerase sigma-70 factor (ECF subfamily)
VTTLRDAELTERIRSGEESAFDTLFRAYYRELCVFAYGYVRSPETAEEIVQDVFAAIWARRTTWSVESTVAAYLFGAVRNQALRRLARGKTERRWHEQAVVAMRGEPTSGGMPAPDREVERDEAERLVRAAVAELPERSRMAITLRWQHQMTHPEIAAAMGISVKGVEHHLERGIKRLRNLLTQLHVID